MKPKVLWGLLVVASFFCSCSREKLSVRNEYIIPERLASYHIRTPDPLRYDPPIGQRLTIKWDLDKEFGIYQEVIIHTIVRFYNHEEREIAFKATRPQGQYIYDILNEAFCETGGILTYKVDLMGDDTILDEWQHQLWTELISFQRDDKEEKQNLEKEQDKE